MKPILVTTENRGVFFGYQNGESPKLPDEITIKQARNCVYWSSDCKGFLGLASSGPTDSCKIGPKVSTLTLYKITSITEVSPEAAERWELAPWN